MRLRHIEVFSAVMLTGSTNGAAQLLHISQPAVSKMLQHAESSAGFALFLRSKGKLVPTPEALRLQQELIPFDELLKRVRRLAASFAQGGDHTLRVAATPALAHHVLPRVMAHWCRDFPKSKCDLAVAHTREIEHALLLNEIDLGLTMQPVTHPNLAAKPLGTNHLCAIAPVGWWPKALLGQPLRPQDLSGEPLITIDAEDYLGQILSNWLAEVEPAPRSVISVQTYSLARSLVEVGIGVALVDGFTAGLPEPAKDIQTRLLTIDAGLQILAVTEQGRPASKSAGKLIQLVRAEAIGLAARRAGTL